MPSSLKPSLKNLLRMFRAPYSHSALLKELERFDVALEPKLKDPAFVESTISQAASICSHGFGGMNPKSVTLLGKQIHIIDQIQYLLVIRQLNRNIKRVTRSKQSDRNTIIKRIKTLCEEGVPHRIYKFDIASFYESIETDFLLESMRGDSRFDRQTIKILGHFFDFWSSASGGLPRGLGISATLAEYAMSRFDAAIRDRDDVYFYSRYVDDIIIITGARENKQDFETALATDLWCPGLSFKQQKTRIIELPNDKPSKVESVITAFDFLGYEFRVTNILNVVAGNRRNVYIDISDKKVRRTKTKIARSFIIFEKTKVAADLLLRLKIISSNYNYYDFSTNTRRNLGFYCNYRQINLEKSNGIVSLDNFLRAYILGYGGKQSSSASKMISPALRKTLLQISFFSNFKKKTFFTIKSKDLIRLRECWQYV